VNKRIFVVDTNILVAGLITANPESPTVKLLNVMLAGGLFYLLSPELLLEYRNVLLRPKLSQLHKLDKSAIDELLTEITVNSIWRESLPDIKNIPPDPQDTHLWSLLESEPGAILITGDELLIKNPPPQNAVIPPRGWDHFFQKTF